MVLGRGDHETNFLICDIVIRSSSPCAGKINNERGASSRFYSKSNLERLNKEDEHYGAWQEFS